ncbi:MAG: hypothetical protein Q9Q40_11040 [Acidobacteriota bacterium]|nr:hypothetical protein [Acidobacteriota bacterium]
MSAAAGLVAIDGCAFDELLEGLAGAFVDGRRRVLLRLAGREGFEEEELRRELVAFSGLECPAREPDVGLVVSRCRGAACALFGECPLVREGPGDLHDCATGRLVASLVERWRRNVDPCPCPGFDDLASAVESMLEGVGIHAASAPPRARTSLALVDLARQRGSLPGLAGPFLRVGEFEQLAAFMPPGATRDHPGLAPVEAWLRRVASEEAAVVEL